MGYSIHYGPAPKFAKNRNTFSLIPVAAAILFLISLSTAKQIWPEEATKLQEALFPWTQESVQEAVGTFVKNLNAGESFQDAAAAFCMEIIDDAQQIQ